MDAKQKAREPKATAESPEGRKSGIGALTQDLGYTTSHVINDVDDSVTQVVENVEDDVKKVSSKLETDVKNTMGSAKDSVKETLGVNLSKSSRFDDAASGKGLTDNIKEPDTSEPYMPGRRNRYMDEN